MLTLICASWLKLPVRSLNGEYTNSLTAMCDHSLNAMDAVSSLRTEHSDTVAAMRDRSLKAVDSVSPNMRASRGSLPVGDDSDECPPIMASSGCQHAAATSVVSGHGASSSCHHSAGKTAVSAVPPPKEKQPPQGPPLRKAPVTTVPILGFAEPLPRPKEKLLSPTPCSCSPTTCLY